jgi:hypothetical protein
MRKFKTKLALLIAVVAIVSALGGAVHWSKSTDDGTETNAVHWGG